MGIELYLLRHAESKAIKEGVIIGGGFCSEFSELDKLTFEGINQSLDSGKSLKSEGITKIYSSSCNRTKETAENLAKEMGLSLNMIIYTDDLREVDFGCLEGINATDSGYESFKELYGTSFGLMNELEPITNVRGRLQKVLNKITNDSLNSGDNKVLVVTHNLVLSYFMNVLLGEKSNSESYREFGNASITYVKLDENGRVEEYEYNGIKKKIIREFNDPLDLVLAQVGKKDSGDNGIISLEERYPFFGGFVGRQLMKPKF